MRGYQYYAAHVFNQAMHDPHVDENDYVEIIEYSDEVADLLYLDRDKLRTEVEHMADIDKMSRF